MDNADESKGFDLKASRWPLSAVLVWIATRDAHCASHCADMSVDACDTWLLIKRTHFGFAPGVSASDAWSGELVPALDDGKLRASAARAVVNRLGTEQIATGIEFPPEGHRFAASGHFFAETDNDRRSVLRPNGSNFAHEWTEYRELAFSRSDVIALWPEWVPEDTEMVEHGASLPYALSPIQMYRWIVTGDEHQTIVAQNDAASIDETDFKKVMLDVGERCRTGKLLATGVIKGEPPAAIDATAWHRYGFHLYGDGIVTVKDISGPVATLLADYRMGRVQRISEEGKKTPVWFDVRIVASDFFREFPSISERSPSPSEAKQSLSLPQQIADWLSATYPQRPALKNKELVAEVRSKAGHFGQFSNRTFETAVSLAYPNDKKR